MPYPDRPIDWTDLSSRLSGSARILTDIPDDSPYLRDATGITARPVAVVEARTIQDIQATIEFARLKQIGITPRGAGTGLSGGAVSAPNAILLSTASMTTCRIDTTLKMAFCEPGVLTKQLQDTAAGHGLSYPPDPASQAECTIGGNVAEGAGGLSCRRFGVTKDYVEGMIAVTAQGQTIRTGYYNEYSGFSQSDLLVASEGSLAIFAEIAIRLVAKAEIGATILAVFPSERSAGQAVADINAAGIIPTVMEFVDQRAAACANRYEKVDYLDSAGALLLLQTGIGKPDGSDMIAACRNSGAIFVEVETDPAKAAALWKVRRSLSKAVKASAPYWLSEDVAVPNSHFPDLVAFVASQNDGGAVDLLSFGHAGDGNLHAVFLWQNDSQTTTDEKNRKVAALMDKTLELGGTVTGEHGIGLVKREFLAREFSPATLKAMFSIKEMYDEEFCLNADKIFQWERL